MIRFFWIAGWTDHRIYRADTSTDPAPRTRIAINDKMFGPEKNALSGTDFHAGFAIVASFLNFKRHYDAPLPPANCNFTLSATALKSCGVNFSSVMSSR